MQQVKVIILRSITINRNYLVFATRQIATDNFRNGQQRVLVLRISQMRVQTRECQLGVELSFKVR